jgi:hypothetical protein
MNIVMVVTKALIFFIILFAVLVVVSMVNNPGEFSAQAEDVNHPPVITKVAKGGAQIEPSNVTRVTKGGNISAEATDKDGDDLVFTWYDGDRVLATGPYLNYSDIPRDTLLWVRLEVTDGTDKVTYTFKVTSAEEESGDRNRHSGTGHASHPFRA